jgi:hypothetical protein
MNTQDMFNAMEASFAKEVESVVSPPKKDEKQENQADDTASVDLGTDDSTKDDGNTTDITEGDDSLENKDSAVGIPEELKDYEELIKSRGWESKMGTPLELIKEIAKSYQEAEKALGRKGSDEKLFVDRLEELEGAITGSPEELNKYRQVFGLDPISVYDPEVEGKEAQDVYNMVDTMIGALRAGKWDADAETKFVNWAKSKEAKLQRHLTLKEAGLTRNPQGKEKITQQAMRTLSTLQEESKLSRDDLLKTLDIVYKDPIVDGLLTRIYGRDSSKLIATPEQGRAVLHLAKKLQLAENFENEVQKRVKAELKKVSGRQNSGAIGGRPASTTTKPQHSTHDAEMAKMFAGGMNNAHFIR